MPDIIEPRVLKGFRDYLPDAEIQRSALLASLETVFRSFGFVPIDTPALEYAEILLGKGGGETDKQVYRFRDHGDRDVALRFDLTVPFARFMAEHVEELYLPFRRYHMAKVWRGENTQRGRYREFMQCDFDIVGTDSAAADADIVLVINSAMAALDAGEFSIRINHRGVFNRFLGRLGVTEKSGTVLRLVDKLEKIGAEELGRLLAEDFGESTAQEVLAFIHEEKSFDATLEKLESLAGGPGTDIDRLRIIRDCVLEGGALARLRLDPSITRGLDYYTGVVFETSLDALHQIGSVCSGGRYDELASLYTSRRLPGVGASVGLDRLLAALEALKRGHRSPGLTKILILNLEESFLPRYESLAATIRSSSIPCELYPEKRKLAAQFGYAERKGIPYAILLGAAEAERGVLTLKNLSTRESRDFASSEAAVALVREWSGM